VPENEAKAVRWGYICEEFFFKIRYIGEDEAKDVRWVLCI
jgi:hypothetical protein